MFLSTLGFLMKYINHIQVVFTIVYLSYVSLAVIKDVSKCKKYPCLIFHDDFEKLDFSVWEHIISAAATGNNEFQYYTNNRTNSYVKNGSLYLQPTLTNNTHGNDFLTNGTLDLYGATPLSQCSTISEKTCKVQGEPGRIINPIQSASIRTRNFAFKYGKLEVRAKLPRGDWIWPAVWLMPKYYVYGSWPASGEIDLFEGRGNDNLTIFNGKEDIGNKQVKQGLHWGPYTALNAAPTTKATQNLAHGSYADKYHTFSLLWTDDQMQFFVDDIPTLDVSRKNKSFWQSGEFEKFAPGVHNPWSHGTKMAPFDESFFLLINNAVGGTVGHFPEEARPKIPWKNDEQHGRKAMTDFWKARHKWLPTWKGEQTALQIDYVKVWKVKPPRH